LCLKLVANWITEYSPSGAPGIERENVTDDTVRDFTALRGLRTVDTFDTHCHCSMEFWKESAAVTQLCA
jgi:hypothetical protein